MEVVGRGEAGVSRSSFNWRTGRGAGERACEINVNYTGRPYADLLGRDATYTWPGLMQSRVGTFDVRLF